MSRLFTLTNRKLTPMDQRLSRFPPRAKETLNVPWREMAFGMTILLMLQLAI